MAKRAEKTRVTRRTVIEETAPQAGDLPGEELEIDGADGADDAPDPEEMDALGKLRDLSGGNSLARFEVRRVLPSANAGYVGTLADEELTMERMAEEFGPGTYTIRVRLPGGKFAGSDRVQIAELPKHKQPAAQPAPVASAAPAAGGSATELVAMMQRATDAQISMLSGLVKSLIERPLPTLPAPPPAPDPIAFLAAAKNLFSKSDSGGGIDLFMKGLEFGKELGGEGGGHDAGDLLLKGIDGLKELSKGTGGNAPRRRLPAPGTVPAIEGPAAAPRPTQQRPTGGTMNTLQLVQWLGKQVQHLLVQASRRKSPELYAEVFLDNLPPGLEESVILERLKAPDAIDQLARLDKRVLHFRDWFEEFGAECVRLIEEGPDDEDDDENELEADEPDAGPGDMPAEFPGGGEGGGEG